MPVAVTCVLSMRGCEAFDKGGRATVKQDSGLATQAEDTASGGRYQHHQQHYHMLGSVPPSGLGRSSIATRAVPTGTRMRKSAGATPVLSWASLYCHTTRRPTMGCTRVMR